MRDSFVFGTVWRLALFAAAHSALASLPVKHRILRAGVNGDREGRYRVAYVGGSALATGALLRSLWLLPDRPLYRLHGWPRCVMVIGQGVGVLGTVAVAAEVGPARFAGVASLADVPTGCSTFRVPVAQHPLPALADGLGWGGPFALCRHPNNFFPLLVVGCLPTMTVKWATVALGTAIYMVLGSLHEEQRLRAAYGGTRFERYRRDVPHLLLPLGRRCATFRVARTDGHRI